MARSRNASKRGPKFWGPVSGTTFQTQPSGITIGSTLGFSVSAGNVSDTELSYLDGAGGDVLACDKGTGFSITGASVAWAGSTIIASHGFTTLQGFTAIYASANAGTAVSPTVCEVQQSAASDANSTVAIVAKQISNAGANQALAGSGGTIFWTAFGI